MQGVQHDLGIGEGSNPSQWFFLAPFLVFDQVLQSTDYEDLVKSKNSLLIVIWKCARKGNQMSPFLKAEQDKPEKCWTENGCAI